MQPATQDQRLRIPGLMKLRADNARRRAIAFLDAPEYVLGIEVRPLTPATLSMLSAMNSRFVVGGIPTETDVRNYLWFHSPLYAHCGVKDWRKRKKIALRRFEMLLAQPWRRWCCLPPSRSYHEIVVARAIIAIDGLCREAFADAGRGKPGALAPVACLEAIMVNTFAREYGWAPERTRHTPLRQLFQLSRCVRAWHGDDVRDDEEDEMLAAHLRERNAQLAEQRENKP